MTIPVDPITQRKLVLVKQLYQHAENLASLRYSMANRILAVIGLDLTAETLLKIVVGALDQRKTPAENLPGLLEQAENLLKTNNLPDLPFRPQMLHVHSVRNDAQHKAKYPNEADVSDCRTYTRDFSSSLIKNCWGISFEQISLLDWIDDLLLRDLLTASQEQMKNNEALKTIALASMAFNSASRSILEFLPNENAVFFQRQAPELSTKTLDYISGILKSRDKRNNYFSALISTGVTLADYKRYKENSPFFEFSYSSTVQEPEKVKLNINLIWPENEPDNEFLPWLLNFVINSIINWQILGLEPKIQDEDTRKQIELLLQWDEDTITISPSVIHLG